MEEKTITKSQAEALAVAYEAYWEARNNKDLDSMKTWARILKSIQDETGCQLHSDRYLDEVLNLTSFPPE